MKSGVACIAFSLHPDDDDLHVSTLSGNRVEKNDIWESTFSNLEMFNDRGLEETATIIGKYVLGIFQIEHPEKFRQYPNLRIEIKPGASKEQLKQLDDGPLFKASDKDS